MADREDVGMLRPGLWGADVQAWTGRGVMALIASALALALAAAPALAAREYGSVGAFGSEGSGNGQFKEPTGIAVNSEALAETAGDVYVIDTANERVERFSSAGTYLGQFSGAGAYEAEGKAFSGPSTPAGSFSFSATSDSQGIAVDSSGDALDPSHGEVYVMDAGHGVIDRFSALGKYEGQLTGTCPAAGTCAPGETIPFASELYGIATDPSGDLWVRESNSTIARFSDEGATVERFETGRGVTPGLVVDGSGNQYVVFGSGRAGKFESHAEVAEFGGSVATSLAVNEASGGVLVGNESNVELFLPPIAGYSLRPADKFPAEGLSGSHGIAVNYGSAEQTVYASQRGADNVQVFNYSVFPAASATIAEISETAMTLEGVIRPEGEPITECRFEYGTTSSYGQSVPCEQSLEAINKGGEEVAVSAKVSGLAPAATRHAALLAANANGSRLSGDVSVSRPAIAGESVSDKTDGEAAVSAQIDPAGLPTGYRVEYGETEAYGSSTPEQTIGASKSTVGVRLRLGGLRDATAYHLRVVATNPLGATQGRDVSFTTNAPVAAFGLPDKRAYELVSNPIDETYLPEDGESSGGERGGTGEFIGSIGDFRAASNGEAIAFIGGESNSGEGGNGSVSDGVGNQYMAQRGPGGWQASDVSLPVNALNGYFALTAFSPDLSVQAGVIRTPASEPVAAEPPPAAECASHGSETAYSHTANGYHALITSAVLGSTTCAATPVAISANNLHVLFEAQGAYTQGAVESSEEREHNLYDSVDGSLHQVNVLPDGEPEQHPSAVFGSYEDHEEAVSSGGSRIVWSALEGEALKPNPKALYVRLNDDRLQSPVEEGGRCTVPGDACTVQVDATQGGPGASGNGHFWAASEDSSKVFFTDCNGLTADSTAHAESGCAPQKEVHSVKYVFTGSDLYAYDLTKPEGERLTDLTVDHNPGDPMGADVQGVIGASADGSYVYFVADGALAPGAERRICRLPAKEEEELREKGVLTEEKRLRLEAETAQEREGHLPAGRGCNLYLWHAGEPTRLVATLSAGDDELNLNTAVVGDWQFEPGNRSAEVTASGNAIAFESTLELTGYDNNGALGDGGNGSGSVSHKHIPELFIYEAGSGRLKCGSCNLSGAPPSPSHTTVATQAALLGAAVGTGGSTTFMPHWIVEREGLQAYFMTSQPLVATDHNGLQDVYEWRSEGSGGCRDASGCLSLISTAEPSSNAFFVDASANGSDLFFTTRAPLTGAGTGETLKLYDARVDGGIPEVSLACTGTGCQGVPPAPPVFSTPASVTFSGGANYPPAGAAKSKHKTSGVKAKPKKKRARCKRGGRGKHGRCAKGRTSRAKSSIYAGHRGGN